VPVLLLDLLQVLWRSAGTFRALAGWAAAHVVNGACAGFGALALTVAVDSVFWGRWLWPEFDVFYYNTVENKSSNWGTAPWHWYFTSALPRSCLAAFPLACTAGAVFACECVRPPRRHPDGRTGAAVAAPDAAARRVVVQLLVPAFAFVALYSALPHKELRFIFYAVPVVNLAAACLVARLWDRATAVPVSHAGSGSGSIRSGTGLPTLGFAVASLAVMAGAGATVFFAGASYTNYPGGEALRRLHDLADSGGGGQKLSVHIGVRAAMTGVSRFGYAVATGGGGVDGDGDKAAQQQQRYAWTYSKDESLRAPGDYAGFDYLLTDDPEFHAAAFEVVEAVEAFAGGARSVLRRALRLQWPFATKPAVYVMRNTRWKSTA
jgi:alpha-1,6-mannosyltransferase